MAVREKKRLRGGNDQLSHLASAVVLAEPLSSLGLAVGDVVAAAQHARMALQQLRSAL